MRISNYNIIKKYPDKVLVYNSFSKASIILKDDSNIDMFENIESFNKLSHEEKKILIDNGFVVDDNRDEFNEIKYIYEQKFFDTSILNIVLVPTLLCNFKCPYCCEKDYTCGEENVKKYFEILKKYAINNFSKHECVQISLFGGEPLIHIDECLKFLDWVKKDSKKNNYKYITSIVTNGSLLTENNLKALLDHNLYSLQITIDSDKENHDKMRIFKNNSPSFDFLIKKINMVITNSQNYKNFKFVLRINLNNTNVHKVRETLELIEKKNRSKVYLLIRAIYNTHAYNEYNTNNLGELKDYFDLGKELGFNILQEKYNYQTCEACGDRKFFYLMPNLSLWKCINDIGYKNGCIGELDENGNIQLIPENVISWYKNCMSGFLDKECINCKMLPDCLGGCPLYKCKHEGKKNCRTFDMSCLPFIY